MRLIVVYEIGDGCTFGCTVTIPVNYDSAESFIVDFEGYCRRLKSLNWSQVEEQSFAGVTGWYDLDCLFDGETFITPEVYTVDEWFNINGLK